jgi:hypothetical protein
VETHEDRDIDLQGKQEIEEAAAFYPDDLERLLTHEPCERSWGMYKDS